MDLSPAPPPPPPDGFPIESPVEPRTSSGRRAVLIAAFALLAVGVVAVVACVSGSGDAFPDTALGLERMDDEQAERAESVIESIRIGDVEIGAALDGQGGEPRLLAATYSNYPEGANAEAIIRGAAAGAEAQGGAVDGSSLQTAESDGYDYACMQGGGPGFLIPGGPSHDGVLCVFHGELVGVLVSTLTTEPIARLADVRAFVEAMAAA